MPATLTIVDALLKEIYEKGAITDLINQETAVLNRVERSSEGVSNDVGGRYVVFPVHTKRNSGLGARRESEILPSSGNQGNAAARVPLHYLYGALGLTGQTLSLADSNPQSFASVLDNEMTGLTSDLGKDLNRQLWSDGTGMRAVASAIGATGQAVFTTSATASNGGTNRIDVGGIYDHVDGTTLGNTNPTVLGTYEVLSVTSTAITFTSNITGTAVAVGDILVRKGSVGSTGTGVTREITGIQKIVSDSGILQNIDPSTVALWKASRFQNSAAPGTAAALTEARMIQAVDGIRQAGNGKTTVGFTSLGVRRAYFNILQAQRQFVGSRDFEGGFSGLEFVTDRGSIPIVVDVDAPKSKIWFLDEKQLKVYREKDWGFMDFDGSKWQRNLVQTGTTTAGTKVGFTDGYDATMFQYMEFATHARNAHGVLEDITEA